GYDLQAEGDVGDLPVVSGDANEAQVGKRTEALQKILRDPELETRIHLGYQQAFGAVGGNVAIIESHGQSRAPLKTLSVGEVGSIGILSHHRDEAGSGGGFSIVLVELQRAGEDGIEAGDG